VRGCSGLTIAKEPEAQRALEERDTVLHVHEAEEESRRANCACYRGASRYVPEYGLQFGKVFLREEQLAVEEAKPETE
jgi:hypothetical protein